MSDIPRGTVVMFSGSIIPDGWLICDGTNSTPDLRGRFVLGGDLQTQRQNNSILFAGGANDLYVDIMSNESVISTDVDIKNHTLTINEIPSHTHEIKTPSNRSLGRGSQAERGVYAVPLGYDSTDDAPYITNTGGGTGHKHDAALTNQKPHQHNVHIKVPYYTLIYI